MPRLRLRDAQGRLVTQSEEFGSCGQLLNRRAQVGTGELGNWVRNILWMEEILQQLMQDFAAIHRRRVSLRGGSLLSLDGVERKLPFKMDDTWGYPYDETETSISAVFKTFLVG